jgi:hypothetical protein
MDGIENMPAYIGSVQFPYPLKWTSKASRVVVGSKRRTRSGNLVVLTVESPSQKYVEARLIFEWTPLSSVQELIDYWRDGGTYSADLEGTGETRMVRFDPEKGVANWKHQSGADVVHAHFQGSENDLYTGELNLIIES